MNSIFLVWLIILLVAWTSVIVLKSFGRNMRLRFTIRDLLWLTVVAALTVGWWLDRKASMERADQDAFAHAKDLMNLGIDLARAKAAANDAQFEFLRMQEAMKTKSPEVFDSFRDQGFILETPPARSNP
jgi:hypothetical protein